jgi:hypothetical protein
MENIGRVSHLVMIVISNTKIRHRSSYIRSKIIWINLGEIIIGLGIMRRDIRRENIVLPGSPGIISGEFLEELA